MDDGLVADDVDAAVLPGIAEDLAGKFELRPLLERILRRSVELLGGDAGSICSVDEAAGVYRKEADIGVACQSGRSFPLTEGMTGAVVRARGPVQFADYRTVPGGHVGARDRETLRGVVGVPILWRGGVVGACVVFSRDPARVFGAADITRLELFARHAAVALANARLYQEAEAHARAEAAGAERDRLVREVHDTVAQGLASVIVHLDAAARGIGDAAADPAQEIDRARESAVTALAETRRTVLGLAPSPLEGRSLAEALELELGWANRTGNLDVRLVEAGPPQPVPAGLAHQLFRIAQEALTNAVRHAGAGSVRIGVIHEDGAVAVLVQDDGQGLRPGRAGGLDRPARHGRAGPADRRHPGRRLGGRLGHPGPGPGPGRRRRRRPDPGPGRRPAPPSPGPAWSGCWPRASRPCRWPARSTRSTPPWTRTGCWRRTWCWLTWTCPTPTAWPACGRCAPWTRPRSCWCCARAATRSARPAPCGPAPAAGWSRTPAAPSWPGPLLAAAQGRAVLPAAALSGVTDAVALTEREREVFALARRGLRDKQIAERLTISVKTVEKHVGAVLRKTGARNRTELATLGEIPTIRTGSIPGAPGDALRPSVGPCQSYRPGRSWPGPTGTATAWPRSTSSTT